MSDCPVYRTVEGHYLCEHKMAEINDLQEQIRRYKVSAIEIESSQVASLRAQLSDAQQELSTANTAIRENISTIAKLAEQLSDANAAIKSVREHDGLIITIRDNWSKGVAYGHRCAASCTDEYWEQYHGKDGEL